MDNFLKAIAPDTVQDPDGGTFLLTPEERFALARLHERCTFEHEIASLYDPEELPPAHSHPYVDTFALTVTHREDPSDPESEKRFTSKVSAGIDFTFTVRRDCGGEVTFIDPDDLLAEADLPPASLQEAYRLKRRIVALAGAAANADAEL